VNANNLEELLTTTAIMNVCQTYSGEWFDPCLPFIDVIKPKDIAHALANSPKFMGHLPMHYSYAQHCVYMADILSSKDDAAMALVYHVGKAYMGSLEPQLARQIKIITKIENRWRELTISKFGIKGNIERVMLADSMVGAAERNQLQRWDRNSIPQSLYNVEHAPIKIKPWKAKVAQHKFLDRWLSLI
jgi:hypothetical protein